MVLLLRPMANASKEWTSVTTANGATILLLYLWQTPKRYFLHTIVLAIAQVMKEHMFTSINVSHCCVRQASRRFAFEAIPIFPWCCLIIDILFFVLSFFSFGIGFCFQGICNSGGVVWTISKTSVVRIKIAQNTAFEAKKI